MLKPGSYDVLVFQDQSGHSPISNGFVRWFGSCKERIPSRVARLKFGQFGDHKTLEGKLHELRLFFGPGYRIYFGVHRGKIVLLLTGGDKSSQRKDIKNAKKLWGIYLEDHP